MVAVLDEAPVTSGAKLELLHDQLVSSAPPLRDELRLGHGAPHLLSRRVEDSLYVDRALRRFADGRSACVVLGCGHLHFPFCFSRNSSRRSSRCSCIWRYFSIHAASSARRRGPSL